MKTLFKAFLFAVVCAALLTSCSKNNGGGGESWSENTVEENKEVVENSAIQVATTLDDMKDVQATDAAVSLGELLDMHDPMVNKPGKKSKVSATIGVIAGIRSGENSIHELFTVMKSAGELEDDPETVQEIWEELLGTYTWNPMMYEWDYEPNSDKVVFLFPSTEDGLTNNAALTVYNYSGVMISNPLEEEYDGDLPASLNMDLKVDNNTLVTYVFTAQYSDDGVPTQVASELDIESFKFSIDLTNNDKEVSANYKFTHGGAIVMEIGGSAKGDFSEENIDKNTTTHSDTWTWTDYQWNESTQTWDEVLVTETDTWEEVEMEEIVNSASAKFQVFDIALKGDVNIKALVDEIDALYPEEYWEDPNFDEKGTAEQEATAINKHLNLRAVNVQNNTKIAEVEAYVVMENYGQGYYDYWVDMRLKFGDGSYIDLETYFEDGFEDFIAEINTMIVELNGEYDWDLEEIDY